MKGRHSSPDAPRQVKASRQVALAVAPVAAIAFAVGCGAAGVISGRPALAAAGAGVGAGAVALEQFANRASRRRQRTERIDLRTQIRDLENQVALLQRELENRSAQLAGTPPPLALALAEIKQTADTGPLPVITYDHPAAPATPRSLPILTANRRGLQSSAPRTDGLQVNILQADIEVSAIGLPAQRPPATPITGLTLPPTVNPDLPRLNPGPSLPIGRSGGEAPRTAGGTGALSMLDTGSLSVLDTGSLPILAPGPSTPLEIDLSGERTTARRREPVLVGAATSPSHSTPLSVQRSAAPRGVVSPVALARTAAKATEASEASQTRTVAAQPAEESDLDAAFRAAVKRAAAVLSAREELPTADEVRGALLGEARPGARHRAEVAEVSDLRARPAAEPMTTFSSMEQVEERVYAEISRPTVEPNTVDEAVTTRQISLFAPMQVPVAMDSQELQRNASSARIATRGLRAHEEAAASGDRGIEQSA